MLLNGQERAIGLKSAVACRTWCAHHGFETIASMKGVEQLDLLDSSHALLLGADAGRRA